MENEILFSDVRQYIVIWCIVGMLFCIVFLVYYRVIEKKYEEQDNKKLQRKGGRVIMHLFICIFFWIGGMIFILEMAAQKFSIVPLIVPFLAMLLPLSSLLKK